MGLIKTTIRQAALTDVDIIAEFNARIASETEHITLDRARVRAGVAALLSDPAKGTYYVAEIASSNASVIAGQLLITYEWSDWRNGNFWWIQSVYVDAAYRGSGVFRALFQHVQTLARQQSQVCGLRLYMDAHNAAARQTYLRLGMKPTNYEMFEIDFVLSRTEPESV